MMHYLFLIFYYITEVNTPMAKLWLFLILLIILGVIGTGIYLMTADIPAPSERVEKTLSDDMFPQ
jgi:hypothetical protein